MQRLAWIVAASLAGTALLAVGLLVDWDSDGLSTGREWFVTNTRAFDDDTDADALSDGLEVSIGFDPRHGDVDRDGLRDDEEYALGTGPRNDDTDGDGLHDGEEVTRRTDPLSRDTDSDDLDDLDEVQGGTDPLHRDTDRDGLDDGSERRWGTDPLRSDSDADDLSDGAEVHMHQSHPLRKDTDNDGLDDGVEVLRYRSSPIRVDSDNDTLEDAVEVLTHGTDPTLADTDADGLDDAMELSLGSDPLVPDTDGDGLMDGDEPPSCILLADCDGDGVLDGDEVMAGLDPLRTSTFPGFHDRTLYSLELSSPEARLDADGDGIPDGLETSTAIDWGPFRPQPGRRDFLVEMVRHTTPETAPVDTLSFAGAYNRLGQAFVEGGIHMQWTETRLAVPRLPELGGQDEFLATHGDTLLASRNPFVHVVLLTPGFRLEPGFNSFGVAGWAGYYDQHGLAVYGTMVYGILTPTTSPQGFALFPQQCMFYGNCDGIEYGYNLTGTPRFAFAWGPAQDRHQVEWSGWLAEDLAGTRQRPAGDTPIRVAYWGVDVGALAHTILHEIGHNMGLCHTHEPSCAAQLPAEEQGIASRSLMSYDSDGSLYLLPSEWQRFRAQLACGHAGNLNALTLGDLAQYRYAGSTPTADGGLFTARRCI